MEEHIAFDALTAVVTAHYLEERRLPPGLVAWLMMEAARKSAETNANNIRVVIKGWSGMGDPVITGGYNGSYTLKVILKAHGGVPGLEYHGTLHRTNRQLVFTTSELGFSEDIRFISNRRGQPMRLEIRQKLPDTLLNGLGALIGMPLSMLASHPSFGRAEAEGIRISRVVDRLTAARSRIGRPLSPQDKGVDVEIEAQDVRIPARR